MDNKAKKQKIANDNDKMNIGKLSKALNNVLVKPTPLKDKDDITLGDWLELKKALYPINNFITKKLTIEFIKEFQKKQPKILSAERIKGLEKKYRDDENANGNGYDIEEIDLHIIAEVKANIPYGIVKYGASQKIGLKKDLNGLLNPQEKKGWEKRDLKALEKCYKFLVVLNYDRSDEYNELQYDTLSAVNDLKTSYKENENIEIIENISRLPQKLTTNKVYIVMLKL